MLTEPDNDELLKLKVDLQEIIALQEELASSSEQPSTTATSDEAVKNPWKVIGKSDLFLFCFVMLVN